MSFDHNGIFHMWVFQTVDKLTLRSLPQPDFRTTVFVPFIGTEIHLLTNKK